MRSLLALAVFSLASLGAARNCRNITTPINISAQTSVFNVTPPRTEIDVTTFVLNIVQQGGNFPATVLTGHQNITGTYNISAQYCEPDGLTDSSRPFLQILTHGSGFDKVYWDFAFNNFTYSYVEQALAAGYCTFAYDRLGFGNSSHGDPINEIQASLELAALREITRQLREGDISEIPHAFDRRVVHIGHSAGSGQTLAFASAFPNETAGIVLTGFSVDPRFGNLFTIGASYQDAATNQPLRFGHIDNPLFLQLALEATPLGDVTDLLAPLNLDLAGLPPALNYTPGYITWQSSANNEALFMHSPNFEPAILGFTEAIKQPLTYGELLSAGGSGGAPSPFTGPVLVFTGENDLPFCGGNCLAVGDTGLPSIPAGAAAAFAQGANKTNFEAYIQPATGHGINAHLNATAGYKVIQDFLKKQNLTSC